MSLIISVLNIKNAIHHICMWCPYAFPTANKQHDFTERSNRSSLYNMKIDTVFIWLLIKTETYICSVNKFMIRFD